MLGRKLLYKQACRLQLRNLSTEPNTVPHLQKFAPLLKDYSNVISPFYVPLDHEILQFVYQNEPKNLLDGGPFLHKLQSVKQSSLKSFESTKYSLKTDLGPGSTEWLFLWTTFLRKLNSLELSVAPSLHKHLTSKSLFQNENGQVELSRNYSINELVAQINGIIQAEPLLFKHQIILYMVQQNHFFKNNQEALLGAYLEYMKHEVNDSKECNVFLIEVFKAIETSSLTLSSESSAILSQIIEQFVSRNSVEAFDKLAIVGVLDFFISRKDIHQANTYLTVLLANGWAPQSNTLSSFIDLMEDPVYFSTLGSILKKVSNAEIFKKLLPYIDHHKKLQFLIKSNSHNLENFNICILSFHKLLDMQFQYEHELANYKRDYVLQKKNPERFKYLLSEASLLRYNRKVTNIYNLFSNSLFEHPKVLIKAIKAYYKGGNYFMINKLLEKIELNADNLLEIFAIKQSGATEIELVSGPHKRAFFNKSVLPIYLKCSDEQKAALLDQIQKYGNKTSVELLNTMQQAA
ncbi:hypothetical protein ACO0QE_004768 [Hanseniaspora vineae]